MNESKQAIDDLENILNSDGKLDSLQEFYALDSTFEKIKIDYG